MHRDFGTFPGSIAVDYGFKDFAVFFPYAFLFTGKIYILLDSIGKAERSFDLCGLFGKAVLLVRDKVVQNLLKLLGIAVRVKGKARKSDDRLAEKPCLEP